jgi:acetoin utilization protein AcuB
MTTAISHYMTAQPYTIQRGVPLAEARRLMREHAIRHLPVLDGANLVGIISDRDLGVFETVPDLDFSKTFVDEAMSEFPFVVTGDTPLDEVLEIMSEKKYGSVIVMGRAGVEGIFTSIDACRLLADMLQRAAA